MREMPGGGQPLKMRYAVRSESTVSAPIAEFITGWLKEIGIATTQKTYDDGQLTELIGKGDYDFFVWGWTPYVDPDPMLSYFTCDQVASDPEDPTNYYNDANWCDQEYDKLYSSRRSSSIRPSAGTGAPDADALLRERDLHAALPPGRPAGLRKDKFEGWVRQPAETGPVLFSNTSPSYVQLKPAAPPRPAAAAAAIRRRLAA